MGPQLALRASHVQIPKQTKGKMEFGGTAAAEQHSSAVSSWCLRWDDAASGLYLADCNRRSAAGGGGGGVSSRWTPMLLCNPSNISV